MSTGSGPAGEARPVRATYRLQLTPEFGFAAARELIPYLRDLGVSHIYLSPSLQARPGSTHGYDVIDPTRISADLGGETGFRSLAAAAHGAGMGIVLDLVPNHMATHEDNRFWTDPELRERFFDIDPATGDHRRFFDIDDLAGVRQEDPSVFEETHRLVLGLVREGVIDALRIDHPDGMADPAQYFARLRAGGADVVWIEKILKTGEGLRDWPVTGTVGYEFLNAICGLFVDDDAEPAFTALWESIAGERHSFQAVAAEAKREQAQGPFRREIERLARTVTDDEAGTEIETVSEDGIKVGVSALIGAVAAMPVYRTYVAPAEGLVTEADRRAIDEAGMPTAVAQRLTLERPAPAEFVTRFQQTTPPVVAKGVEDTAFYRYARLVALNEVGGDPGRFGVSVSGFHRACAERARRFPQGMLTTNTHDTKRSADVRARIVALTWIPDEWEPRVRGWMELTNLLCEGAPDDVERYFLFQTLVGAWPIEVQRIEGYMVKALREAKRNSNWIEPNQSWEASVLAFCRALYEFRPFRDDFERFVERVTPLGDRIALGMLALKLTAPGVPDIYQGDELEFRALVDPDNRRAVDWEWRQAMLARLSGGSPPDAATMKMWLTRRLLALRIRRPEAFAGAYTRLSAGERCVAFRRGDDVLVAVAVRPPADGGGGSDARPEQDVLEGAAGEWQDVLAGDVRTLGEQASLDDLLGEHGIAVLERPWD
ncbi:MAG: malto-oligosyltrehalose synthase [Solirubrobacteraceae bacterium]